MTSPDAPNFDALYTEQPDPWQVATSWYERRKREVLLASLPNERYDSAWEPGCGIGETTRLLGARTDHLVASDPSAVAVESARARIGRTTHVELLVSGLPEVPVPGPVSLVVVAEFLYYLDDLERSLDAVWSATTTGTHLVVQHWVHHPHDGRLGGIDTHRVVGELAAARGARHLVGHRDQHFLLDVFEMAR